MRGKEIKRMMPKLTAESLEQGKPGEAGLITHDHPIRTRNGVSEKMSKKKNFFAHVSEE